MVRSRQVELFLVFFFLSFVQCNPFTTPLLSNSFISDTFSFESSDETLRNDLPIEESSNSFSSSSSSSSSSTSIHPSIGLSWYQHILFEIFTFVDSFPKFLSVLFIIIIFVVSQVFCIPGTPINLASGLILGFWFGCIGSVVGCISGALVGFILGRTFFRKWIQKKAETNETLRGIDEAISAGRRPFLLIFLVRLSPLMPFPLCSYFFGLTKVTFLQHGIASFLGLLPGTVAYTYFGSLMKDIADVTKGTSNLTFSIVMLSIGIVSLIVVSIIVGKIVSRVIKDVRQKKSEMHDDLLENKSATSDKEFIELENIEIPKESEESEIKANEQEKSEEKSETETGVIISPFEKEEENSDVQLVMREE